MRPILFHLGPLPIKSWGVLVAIAFLVGLFIAKKRAEKKGISGEKIYDLAFYLLISGLISGRLLFIIFDIGYFIKNPIQVFMIQDGGMAIHGALIGGFTAAYIFCRKNKISLPVIGDIIGPVILLSQGIGRIGCFLNGDDYGFPTKSIIGVKFPNLSGGPRLPTQLFEVVPDLIAFGLLLAFEKKFKKDGQVFYVSIILYSVIRFTVELFRDDMGYLIGWLTWGEAASLAMIAVAAVMLVRGIKSRELGVGSRE